MIIVDESHIYILFILNHPVHPVIYMDVVYAGFAWSKNLSRFSCKVFHKQVVFVFKDRRI